MAAAICVLSAQQIFDHGLCCERAITLGEGIINKVQAANGRISCDGNDLLDELKYQLTLPNYTVNQSTVQAAVTSLVAALGWTVEASGTALTQVVVEKFEDCLTLLRAVLTVADHTGVHIRRGSQDGRVIQVGNFGTSNDLTLFDPSSGRGGDRRSGIIEGSKLANWILPMGSDGLTLQDSTNPEKRTITGPDGNPAYYVSDLDSIAEYGLRQAYQTEPDIKPLSGSAGDIIAASNQLCIVALAELAKRSVIRRS